MNTIKQTKTNVSNYLKSAISSAIVDAGLTPVSRFETRYFDLFATQSGSVEMLLTLLQGDTDTESFSTRRMNLSFVLNASIPGDPLDYIDAIRPLIYGNLGANCVSCTFENFDAAEAEDSANNSLFKIEFSVIN